MAAADGIGNQVHTLALGQALDYLAPVVIAIVDRVVQAAFLQKSVFAGAGGTVNRGADMGGNINGRQSDTAARVMNQHGFVGLESAHGHQQLPGSEVVDRNGGGLFEGKAGGLGKDPADGSDDAIGLTAEVGQGCHFLSDPATVIGAAHRIHHASHFVSHGAGQGRRIRIQSLTCHDVGKIEPGGLYPDAYFPGAGCGILCFLDLEYFRGSGTGDDDPFHGCPASSVCSISRKTI